MFARASDGTPRPVFRAIDKTGAHRVRGDVGERREVVILVVDDPGRKPLGEEGAAPAVSRVVLACVVTLEPLDSFGEALCGAVHDRVVVGAHQAVGVEPESEASHSAAQEPDEQEPVARVAEELSFVDAPRRHVKVPVGKA
jgi:hypothetical protein